MTCLDKITDEQRQEITNLLAPALAKRAAILKDHYGMCYSCVLHLLASAVIAVVKVKNDDLTLEEATDAVIHAIARVFDMQVVHLNEEDLPTTTTTTNKRKMH